MGESFDFGLGRLVSDSQSIGEFSRIGLSHLNPLELGVSESLIWKKDGEVFEVPDSKDDDREDLEPQKVVLSYHLFLKDMRLLEYSLQQIFGKNIRIKKSLVEVVNADEGLVINIKLVGTSGSERILGDLDLTLGPLTLTSYDGKGTASLRLAEELFIEDSAILHSTREGLDILLLNPWLIYSPKLDESAVTHISAERLREIGVTFQVELLNLPEDTSFQAHFAGDPSVFVDGSDDLLSVATETLGDLIDFAFAVVISKINITNEDLGTIRVTILPSREWYEKALEEDRSIAIVNLD